MAAKSQHMKVSAAQGSFTVKGKKIKFGHSDTFEHKGTGRQVTVTSDAMKERGGYAAVKEGHKVVHEGTKTSARAFVKAKHGFDPAKVQNLEPSRHSLLPGAKKKYSGSDTGIMGHGPQGGHAGHGV